MHVFNAENMHDFSPDADSSLYLSMMCLISVGGDSDTTIRQFVQMLGVEYISQLPKCGHVGRLLMGSLSRTFVVEML